MSASSLSVLANSANSSRPMEEVKTTRYPRTALHLINNQHQRLLTSWEWYRRSSRDLRRQLCSTHIQTLWWKSLNSCHTVTRQMCSHNSSALLTSTITRSTTLQALSPNLLCSLRSQKWRSRTMQKEKWNNALLSNQILWQKTWLSSLISSSVSWEASQKVGNTSKATTSKQPSWRPKTNKD